MHFLWTIPEVVDNIYVSPLDLMLCIWFRPVVSFGRRPRGMFGQTCHLFRLVPDINDSDNKEVERLSKSNVSVHTSRRIFIDS